MKFTWKGKWRKGEIVIEAETLQELDNALRALSSRGKIQGISEIKSQSIPKISPSKGCANALRVLMETEWGKQPRSMKEIKGALEANALYFSKGTLSGTLTTMTKRGELQRVKEEGKWKYLAK